MITKQECGVSRTDDQIRVLCIVVVLFGVVSFRSVPRILKLFLNPIEWIPHFTSVINWTLLLGLSLLKQVSPLSEKWIAVIDHSINIGVKKVMVVLRVKLDALAVGGSAINTEDCECIGIQISEKTDGETVFNSLSSIFEKAGNPTAIIRDCGSGLARGVDLWRKQTKQSGVPVIEDIGHVIANALKAEFSKNKKFKSFLNIVNIFSRRLRQTQFAFLSPPKLRTKGRFQGIGRLADWALKIISTFSCEKNKCEDKTLKKILSKIFLLEEYILNFAKEIMTGNEIMKILKTEGFNQKKYWETRKLAESLPIQSRLRKRVLLWQERLLTIHCRLGIGQIPLMVSSDIIESLFGKFKHIIERGSAADMNRTVLIIPTLCGKIDSSKIEEDLSKVSHSELYRWEQEQAQCTQNKLRRKFTREVISWVPNSG